LAQLAALITQIQAQQQNTGGGNIGDGTEAVLKVGSGLSGGGPMLGTVLLNLTAPIPFGLDDGGGGGDGDPGPPGMAGAAGPIGLTGGTGPAGPAIFMAVEDGQDGMDAIPGNRGAPGANGSNGATGGIGPAGPAIFMAADDGEQGEPGFPGPQGVAGTGGGSSAAAVPATIAGLIYWMNASTLAAAAGGAISVLGSPDQVRVPFTLASSGGGGTVGTTQLNGKNVLTCPGTSANTYLISGPTFAIGAGATIFAVFKPASFANYGGIVSGNSGSLILQVVQTSGLLNLGNAAVSSIATSTGALTAGTWAQFNASYTNSTGAWVFRINSAADSSGTSSGAAANAITTFFDYGGGGEQLNGDIAEVLVYNRVLTLAEKQSVESYLHTEWGV
jgi:Concanavalin A-like lectin/glucanases superfamily